MRIGFIYLGGDDPRKNTALKLERMGLASRVVYRKDMRGLALTPFSDTYVTPADHTLAERWGIFALDCSWSNVDRISKMKPRTPRKLPPLVPANPVKYGQVSILSTVEALSAALYLVGEQEKAALLLSKFKWGANFLVLNRLPLEEYSRAKDSSEIEKIAASFF